MVKTNTPAKRLCFLLCCELSLLNRNVPNFYTGTSIKKMVELSTEALANINASPLCALQDSACANSASDQARSLFVCTCTPKLTILCRKCEHRWAQRGYQWFVDALPRLRDIPLPGGRNSRVASFQACNLPMKYQVPVASFFWSGSEGIHYPLPQQKKHLYTLPHLFTIFSCKVLFWANSSAEESPEYSTFSLQSLPEGRF